MIDENQLPERYRDVIDEQIKLHEKGRTIEVVTSIPDTPNIPIEDQTKWLRITDVICVFVDMLGSTRLSAEEHDKSTAGAYQLFSGTAVQVFNAFEAPYIDVKGDGVFALFDSTQVNRALAAAVTFKTFAEVDFVPIIQKKINLEIGCHIGIDQRTVLVRKIGLKRSGGRTDRQNEVWAGRPVNMAAKLASLTNHGELLVSDRYFVHLKDDHVLLSCGCSGGKPTGVKKKLWDPYDVSHTKLFDFDTAHILKTMWCENHGNEYCEAILALDEE